MAKTFTLTSGAYQGRYLELHCVQTTDISNNRSTINWTLSSLGGESSYYQTGPTTVTIAGVQVYYCPKMAWDSYQFPAAKGSVGGSLTVNHDTYGKLTIAVSMSTNIYTGVINTYSNNWTLDSIPRQATITSANDFTDVDNPSISFSNPGGYPMDVWLEPNPDGDHLCVREGIPNIGSYTWELADDEIEALRNRCAGNSCKIRIGLYSYPVGGVTYADYKDITYTMTENEATKPSVRMSVALNNGSLPSIFDGMCIQGKSRVDVSISAEGKYGADIESYWANVDGKEYSYKLPFTSDVIQSEGSVTVSGFAKDSRGFTGSDEQTIQVVEYAKPQVVPIGNENAILCYRSDIYGKRDGSSTSVWIKASKSYHGLATMNSCALQWRRKKASEEWDDKKHEWSDLLPRMSAADAYDELIPNVEFDLLQAYTIQIRAIDDIGEYDTKTLEVPTRDVALHLGRGGKNVSVGTYCDYSEDYTFYSEWKAIFGNDVNVLGKLGINGKSLTDVIYPVGAIYLSVNSTSPADLFGGTWEQLKDRFLLGVGDIYKEDTTGGEASHILTVDEMPRHNHVGLMTVEGELNYDFNRSGAADSGGGYGTSIGSDWVNIQTRYTGADRPHNNMPPYLAVYMWKRTA